MQSITREAEIPVSRRDLYQNVHHHRPHGATVNAGRMPVATGTQVVHEPGGVGDPAEGCYAGLPGKLFAKVIHDGAGRWPTFFTDAAGILFDNRIPPLATDVSRYRFAVPPGDATLHVRARLLYRRSFRALTDATGWTLDGHGNPCTTDRCDPADGCRHAVTIGPCDDGDACTGADTCRDGVCTGGPIGCDDGNACTLDACDPAAGCSNVVAPRADCVRAARSAVDVRDADTDGEDVLTWRWAQGAATDALAFGDPAVTSGYTFCLYDREGGVARLATALHLPPGAGWEATTSGGWAYHDPTGSQDGIRWLRLKPGGDGETRITLEAKGRRVAAPRSGLRHAILPGRSRGHRSWSTRRPTAAGSPTSTPASRARTTAGATRRGSQTRGLMAPGPRPQRRTGRRRSKTMRAPLLSFANCTAGGSGAGSPAGSMSTSQASVAPGTGRQRARGFPTRAIASNARGAVPAIPANHE
jgi:hypothetical protein